MNVTYSYGGRSAEEPLVKKTVEFVFNPDRHSCLQEALLERTELILASLTSVFDDAKMMFDAEIDSARNLDVMVSTALYATKNIIAQSPSVKYAVMFERIQQVFARLDVVEARHGAVVKANVMDLLKPVWFTLRAIDATFGENASEST